jgi:hypothetical protein
LEKAAALWKRGERGAALALVYGKLRRSSPLSSEGREAKKAALACVRLLGTDMPLLDALPSPIGIALFASLATIAGLALFVSENRARKRGGDARPGSGGRRAAGRILLVLALALVGLGAASASERRRAYAVVWANSLRTVPSELSELSVSVVQGSTARLRGRSGGFLSLALADGIEGWAAPDQVFFY